MLKCKKEYFKTRKLIEISKNYYPKFYKEFILNFKNKKSLDVFIKLTIDIENDEYIYLRFDSNVEYHCYNYENIIRDLAIKHGIYKDEEEMRKDCFNKCFVDINKFLRSN